MTTQATFPHLTPVYPTLDRLLSCDLCHASEVDDIIATPFPTVAELRPMYRDERDGITVCHECAVKGEYLVIETESPLLSPGQSAPAAI